MRWIAALLALVVAIYAVATFADPAESWLTPEVPMVNSVTTVPVILDHNPQPVPPNPSENAAKHGLERITKIFGMLALLYGIGGLIAFAIWKRA